MSISLVLEVAIAMVFLYLLGSQILLSIFELLSGYFNKRGRFLRARLTDVLGASTTQALYSEPTIARLSPKGKDGLPPYIPTDIFAATLLRLAAPAAADAQALLARLSTSALAATEAEKLLQGLLGTLVGTTCLADCQKTVAVWYDAFGERMTGWYKRRVRGWLFGLALALALAFGANIDSLYILRYLWLHPQASQGIAIAATRRASGSPGSDGPGAHLAGSAPILSAAADTVALAQALRAALDSANAYESRLARHGFPVGRTPTAPVDSATLPARFRIYQPKQTVRLGRTTYSVDDHYLYYALLDRPDSLPGGVKTHSLAWISRPVSLTSRFVKNIPDRTGVVGADVAWLSPHPDCWWPAWVGWLVTAVALSVGAPFWFDLLCRLVNIRNLGIRPPRTGRE